MSLKMIYGRSGSGKTTIMYDLIKKNLEENPSSNHIILVPEQYTFRSEQKVLKDLKETSIFNVSVMSFNSIVKKVLNTVGGSNHDLVSETGKTMLMTRALFNIKDELVYFKRVSKNTGFIELAKELVDQMKRFDIDIIEFEKIIDNLDDIELLQKLKDIKLFYSEYNKELSKNYIDLIDEANYSLEKFKDAFFLKDSFIYIDEFNDFSEIQYKILEKIFLYAKKTYISLTIDVEDRFNDIFYITKDTDNKLSKVAVESSTYIEKPIIIKDETPKRFQKGKELDHLQKEFFKYPSKKFIKEPSNIKLYRAQNRYDEVERVCTDIINKTREDDTLKYNDIAILCRDIESYESVIRSVFREHDLPIFLDKRLPIDGNLLSLYIISLLEMVVYGYSYENVFKLLKTGLTKMSIDDIHILENYILAYDIKGYKYNEVFEYSYPNIRDEKLNKIYMDKVNNIREELILIYNDFLENIKEKITVKEKVELLFIHLSENEIFEKTYKDIYIDESIISKKSEGILKEQEEVNKSIIEIMDNFVEVLGEDILENKDFLSIFKAAIESHEAAIIPFTLDQIIVGDVARVKTGRIKNLYILGANDGIFPRTIRDDELLSDKDIIKIKEEGVEIGIDSRSKSFYEQFLVYTAFSTASEFMWISYAASDIDGKSLRPSIVISRLKNIFINLEEEVYINPYEVQNDGIESLDSRKGSFNKLIHEMRRDIQGEDVNPLWGEVYNYYDNNPEYKYKLKIAESGLEYTNQVKSLSEESANKLYDKNLYLSVSKIEKFSECPFAYYVRYGLMAKERKFYEMTPPDIGTLMHSVIDQFTEDIKGIELGISSLDKEFIRESVDLLVDKEIEKNNLIYKSSPRYRYMGEKVKKIIYKSIDTLTAQIAKGDFIPMFNELGFGVGSNLPPLAIDIPGEDKEALLMGRIDRIDVLEMEGKSYIRIIDYKSSDKNISLNDVYYGLQLQLLVYLEVVLKNWEKLVSNEAIPGAILYFRMDNPMIKGSLDLSDKEIEIEILKSLRMKGMILNDAKVIKSMDKDMEGYSLVIPARFRKDGELSSASKETILTEEEFTILREYTKKKLGLILKEMVKGNISIVPYKNKDLTPCRYCEYKSICQFDTKIKDNNYNNLRLFTTDELWNNMQKTKEEEDGKNLD
ncbi:MAG: helicase-exonuclease AddAB subunit AddB [Clostridium sp.]|nr:helicase-exonuclease AddAB subunit AddB [Clostridium sp.]